MTQTLAPIHTTLTDEAMPGDTGWLWFDGNWHISEVYETGDRLNVEILGSGEFENMSLPIGHPDVRNAPWLKISRPPYEGDDERPCTHALTMVDSSLSWTLSFRATDEKGAEISRAVSSLVHSMLETRGEKVA